MALNSGKTFTGEGPLYIPSPALSPSQALEAAYSTGDPQTVAKALCDARIGNAAILGAAMERYHRSLNGNIANIQTKDSNRDALHIGVFKNVCDFKERVNAVTHKACDEEEFHPPALETAEVALLARLRKSLNNGTSSGSEVEEDDEEWPEAPPRERQRPIPAPRTSVQVPERKRPIPAPRTLPSHHTVPALRPPKQELGPSQYRVGMFGDSPPSRRREGRPVY